MPEDPNLTGVLRRIDERIATVEKAVLLLPALAAEALLIVSLFLPFVTVRSFQKDDEVITLFQLGTLFGGGNSNGESGEVDGVGVLFGVAFLGLMLVMLCAVAAVAVVLRGNVSPRGAAATTTIGVLLTVGTLGAWLVVGLGITADSPWAPEAGSFTLVAAAVLVAVLAFAPPFRRIWMRR
ncbi:hypothetical protein MMM2322_01837 [Microbacterium sp. MM2322]